MLQLITFNEIGKPIYAANRIHIENFYWMIQNHSVIVHSQGKDNKNLFYTLAHHNGANIGFGPVRSHSSFEMQEVIGFDINGVAKEHAIEYAEVVAQILEVPIAAITSVLTGRGVQVLVGLRSPIRDADYFRSQRRAFTIILEKIKELMITKGLPGEPDYGVFDPSRLFRLPGSLYSKGEIETECKLITHGVEQVELNLKLISGIQDMEEKNVSPEEIRRSYPAPDLASMEEGCEFVKWCIQNPRKVHESDTFDMYGLLAAQTNQEAAKQIGKRIYDSTTHSLTVPGSTFEQKYEWASRYGAKKCESIHARWGKCHTCKYFGKIKTPLAIKSKTHISSAANGYWVLNRHGNPSKPHYADLQKVFYDSHPYVVTPEGNIFVYDGKKYNAFTNTELKSWVESALNPADSVEERHRGEFVSKVKAYQVMSEQQQTDFFERSIEGKLNCQNGVLDIKKGKLLPHSKEYGFFNLLPYDFDNHGHPHYFLDWLKQVTMDSQSRTETLLDVMAAMLWPQYDDHFFVYLTGEGGNGKSTFLEILQAMVGPSNFSAVNITQLCEDRFAPASLHGKLFNLSEESSGNKLSSEHLNFIKNASSGGMLTVQEKNKPLFMVRNKTKLLFSANNIPQFEETNWSIQRRLIVVPFDHQIEQMTDHIKDQLIAQAPTLLGFLVKRIQENLKINQGKFILYRGGQEGLSAKEEFLTSSNTAIQWAKDHLERLPPGEEQYLTIRDAYFRYLNWCKDNRMRRSMNRNAFSRTIHQHFLHDENNDRSNVKRIGDKTFRVFWNVKLKEEVIH